MIQTTNYSKIRFFCEEFPNDPISKDFSQRFIPTNDYYSQSLFWDFDKEGVKEGRVAAIYPFNSLQIVKRALISDGFQEDIDFHISRSNVLTETQPYFMFTNRFNFNDTLALVLDQVLLLKI